MQTQAETADTIREIREARFTTGIVCPHCPSRRCHRWGSFAARQRYRCTACRRTFSDFTNSPAAYLKRIDAFAKYRVCMRASASVRSAAAMVGVHKDTAFRWRHRLLDEARLADATRLTGLVEMDAARFAYAAKGRADLEHPRRRGLRSTPLHRPVVWVTFGADRSGGFVAAITGGRHSSVTHLVERFGPRLRSDAVLLTAGRSFGGHAGLARLCGVSSVTGAARGSAARSLVHVGNVGATISGFRGWLEPFRGVSTCYLENYLAWYALLRRAERGQGLNELFQWRLHKPEPTVHADTAQGSRGVPGRPVAADPPGVQ